MIELSERAVEKVKELADETAKGKDLRVFVDGVGCSGFRYGFTFDDQRDGDTVVDSGELRVLVDPYSAPHLSGARVDFVDDERGAGFTIDNPNAPAADACGGGCSCG